MEVVDKVTELIGIDPRRETGVYNETFLWFIFSVLWRSLKIMTNFYNYFIVSHPFVVLCMYLFAYCYLRKYIIGFGRLLSGMATFDNATDGTSSDKDRVRFGEPSPSPSEIKREGFHGVMGKRQKGAS